ncbi:SDR family oxidoreductase, partial [uncultured Adlercreutzia sp.]|uniref:SDR family oxidoreductase n=1 Tax=uncultured Adlercreutzia sp. TaxID=875803 RepID=UPI0026F3D5F6
AVNDNLTDDFKKFFLRHIPLGRMADPEHIAAAVVYFASDESACTTGQLLEVSGGFGLATPIFADAMDAAVQR